MAEDIKGNAPGEIVELQVAFDNTETFIERAKDALIKASLSNERASNALGTPSGKTGPEGALQALSAIAAGQGGLGPGLGAGKGPGPGPAEIQSAIKKAQAMAEKAKSLDAYAKQVAQQSQEIATNLQSLFASMGPTSVGVRPSEVGSAMFRGIANPAATGFTVSQGGRAVQKAGIRSTGQRRFSYSDSGNFSREDLTSLGRTGGDLRIFDSGGKQRNIGIDAGSSLEQILAKLQTGGTSVKASGAGQADKLDRFLSIIAQTSAEEKTSSKEMVAQLKIMNAALREAGLPALRGGKKGLEQVQDIREASKATTADVLRQLNNQTMRSRAPGRPSVDTGGGGNPRAGGYQIDDFREYVELQQQLAQAVTVIKGASRGILNPGTVRRLGAAYEQVKRTLQGRSGIVELLTRMSRAVTTLGSASTRLNALSSEFRTLATNAQEADRRIASIVKNLQNIRNANIDIKAGEKGGGAPGSGGNAAFPATVVANVSKIATETAAIHAEMKLLRQAVLSTNKRDGGGVSRSTIPGFDPHIDGSAPYGTSGNFQNQKYHNISGTLLNPGNIFKTQKEELTGMNAQLDIAYKRVTLYAAAASSVYGVVRAFQAAGRAIADVDERMAKLRFLMNDVRTNFQGLQKDAFGVAKAFGFSINETLDAMVIFAQQGRSMADVIKLVESSLVAANQTTLTATKATEALTAAMALFNVKAENSRDIIDSWANVANKNAVSAEVLTDAMRKVGGAAIAAGVSFHELNALVTTVAESTRKSGQEIGTSLKFIFQRIAKPETIATLEKMNIAVLTASGNIRPLADIFQEVSDKMSSFDDIQRRTILTTIAGIRHYSDLNILLKNLDKVYKVTGDSQNSFGVSARNNEVVLRTLVKEYQNLKTAFAEVAVEVGTGGLVDFVRLLTGAGKAAAEALKLIPDSIKGAVTAGGLFVVGISAMATALNALVGTQLPSLIERMGATAATQKAATQSSIMHSTALSRETERVLTLARAYGTLGTAATGANTRFAGGAMRSTVVGPGFYDDAQKYPSGRGYKAAGSAGRFVTKPTSFQMGGGSPNAPFALVPTQGGAMTGPYPRPQTEIIPAPNFRHYGPSGGGGFYGGNVPPRLPPGDYPLATVPPPDRPPFGRRVSNFFNTGLGSGILSVGGILGSGYFTGKTRDQREQLGGNLGPGGVAYETLGGAAFGGAIGSAFAGLPGAGVGAIAGGTIGFLGGIRDYTSELERQLETSKRNLQVFQDQIDAVKELKGELERIQNIEYNPTTGNQEFAPSVTLSPVRARGLVYDAISKIGNVNLADGNPALNSIFTGGTDDAGIIATRFSSSFADLSDSNKELTSFIKDLGLAMDDLKDAVVQNNLLLGRRDIDELFAEVQGLRSAPGYVSGDTIGGRANQITGGVVPTIVGKVNILLGDFLDEIGLNSIGSNVRQRGQVSVQQGEIIREFSSIDNPAVARAVVEAIVSKLVEDRASGFFDTFRTVGSDAGRVDKNLNALQGFEAYSLESASAIYDNVGGRDLALAIINGNQEIIDEFRSQNPSVFKEISAISRETNAQFYNQFYRNQGIGALKGNLDFQRNIVERGDYTAVFNNVVGDQGIDGRLAFELLRKNDVLFSGNRQEIVQNVTGDSVTSVALRQNELGRLEPERDEQGNVKIITRTAEELQKFVSELDESSTLLARMSDRGRSFSGFVGNIDKELADFQKTVGRIRQGINREVSLIRRELSTLRVGGAEGINPRIRSGELESLAQRSQNILTRRGATISNLDRIAVPEEFKGDIPGFKEFVEQQRKAAETGADVVERTVSSETKLRQSIDKLNDTLYDNIFSELRRLSGQTSALELNRVEGLEQLRAAGNLDKDQVRDFLRDTTIEFSKEERKQILDNPQNAPELIRGKFSERLLTAPIDDGKLPRSLSAISLSLSEQFNTKGVGIEELQESINQAILLTGIASKVARERSLDRDSQLQLEVAKRTEGGTGLASEISADIANIANASPEQLKAIQATLDKLRALKIAIDESAASLKQQNLKLAFDQLTASMTAFGTALNAGQIADEADRIAAALGRIQDNGGNAGQAFMQIANQFSQFKDELGRSTSTADLEKAFIQALEESGIEGLDPDKAGDLFRKARSLASQKRIGSTIGQAQESIDATLARQDVFGLSSQQDLTQSLVSTYKSAVDGLIAERQRLIRDGYDAEVEAIDKLINKYKEMNKELQAQQNALKPFSQQLDEAIASTLLTSGNGTLVAFDDSIKQTISGSSKLRQLGRETGALPGVTLGEAQKVREELDKQGDEILESLQGLRDEIGAAFSEIETLEIKFTGLDDLKAQLDEMREKGVEIPVKFLLPGKGPQQFAFTQEGNVVDAKTGQKVREDSLARGGRVTRDGVIAELHHGEVVVPSSLTHLLSSEITDRLGLVTGNTGIPKLQSGGIIAPFNPYDDFYFDRKRQSSRNALSDAFFSRTDFAPLGSNIGGVYYRDPHRVLINSDLFKNSYARHPDPTYIGTTLASYLGHEATHYGFALNPVSFGKNIIRNFIEGTVPGSFADQFERATDVPFDQRFGPGEILRSSAFYKKTGEGSYRITAGDREYELRTSRHGNNAYVGWFGRSGNNRDVRGKPGDIDGLVNVFRQLMQDEGIENFTYTPMDDRQQKARIRMFEAIRKKLGLSAPEHQKITNQGAMERYSVENYRAPSPASSIDTIDISSTERFFNDISAIVPRRSTLTEEGVERLLSRIEEINPRGAQALRIAQSLGMSQRFMASGARDTLNTISDIRSEYPDLVDRSALISDWLLERFNEANRENIACQARRMLIGTEDPRFVPTMLRFSDEIDRSVAGEAIIPRIDPDGIARDGTLLSRVPRGAAAAAAGDVRNLREILEFRTGVRNTRAGKQALSRAAIGRLISGVQFDLTGDITGGSGGAFVRGGERGRRSFIGLSELNERGDPDMRKLLAGRELVEINNRINSMLPNAFTESGAPTNILTRREAEILAEDLRRYGELTGRIDNFDLNAITHERFHDLFADIRESNPKARALLANIEADLEASPGGRDFIARVRDAARNPGMAGHLVAEEFLTELLTGDIRENGTLGKYEANTRLLSEGTVANIGELIDSDPNIQRLIAQSELFQLRATQAILNDIADGGNPNVVAARDEARKLLHKKLERAGIKNPDDIIKRLEETYLKELKTPRVPGGFWRRTGGAIGGTLGGAVLGGVLNPALASIGLPANLIQGGLALGFGVSGALTDNDWRRLGQFGKSTYNAFDIGGLRGVGDYIKGLRPLKPFENPSFRTRTLGTLGGSLVGGIASTMIPGVGPWAQVGFAGLGGIIGSHLGESLDFFRRAAVAGGPAAYRGLRGVASLGAAGYRGLRDAVAGIDYRGIRESVTTRLQNLRNPSLADQAGLVTDTDRVIAEYQRARPDVQATRFLTGEEYVPYNGRARPNLLNRFDRYDRINELRAGRNARILGGAKRGVVGFAGSPFSAVFGSRAVNAQFFSGTAKDALLEEYGGSSLALAAEEAKYLAGFTVAFRGGQSITTQMATRRALAGGATQTQAAARAAQAGSKFGRVAGPVGGALALFDISEQSTELSDLILAGELSKGDIYGRTAGAIGTGAVAGGSTGALFGAVPGAIIGGVIGGGIGAGAVLTAEAYATIKSKEIAESLDRLSAAEASAKEEVLYPVLEGILPLYKQLGIAGIEGGINLPGTSLQAQYGTLTTRLVNDLARIEARDALDRLTGSARVDFLNKVISGSSQNGPFTEEDIVEMYARQKTQEALHTTFDTIQYLQYQMHAGGGDNNRFNRLLSGRANELIQHQEQARKLQESRALQAQQAVEAIKGLGEKALDFGSAAVSKAKNFFGGVKEVFVKPTAAKERGPYYKANANNYLFGVEDPLFYNNTGFDYYSGDNNLLKEGYQGFGPGDDIVPMTALVTPKEWQDILARQSSIYNTPSYRQGNMAKARREHQAAKRVPTYVSYEDARKFMRTRILEEGGTFDAFGGTWYGLNREGLQSVASASTDAKLKDLAERVLEERETPGGLRPERPWAQAYHSGGYLGRGGKVVFGTGDMDRYVVRADERVGVFPQSILQGGINDSAVRRVPGSENFPTTGGRTTEPVSVENRQDLNVRLGGFQFINQGGKTDSDEVRNTLQEKAPEIAQQIIRELTDKPLAIYG